MRGTNTPVNRTGIATTSHSNSSLQICSFILGKEHEQNIDSVVAQHSGMHWIKFLGHLCHPVFSPPTSCTTGTQHWWGVPLLTHTSPSLSILVTLWGPLTAMFPPASAQTHRKSLQLLLAPFQVWGFYQARLEKANIKSGTWWPLPAAPPCLWTHPLVKAFLRSYQHWYTLGVVRVSLCMSACADIREPLKNTFFLLS